jgi:hypothetical protein
MATCLLKEGQRVYKKSETNIKTPLFRYSRTKVILRAIYSTGNLAIFA